MKKAIVIGATSGLGREIAMNLVREGWSVGVAGRRVELLKEFAIYERIDVTTEDAVNGVERLVEKLGGMDLFVNVAGVGFQNPTLDPKVEKYTFDVNGYGFMRMVDWAYNYFKATRQPLSPTDSSPKTGEQYEREGHIAIISSIAGTKPLGTAVAYSATKRMQSHYLTGLAQLARMTIPPRLIPAPAAATMIT